MKRDAFLVTVLLFTIAYIIFIGAKPEPEVLPGICLYEVSVNTVGMHVSIGWTSSPCLDLDIKDEEDYNKLQHSSFRPACPVYSVQAWPNIYLPTVSYHSNCNLNLPLEPKAAVLDHAIITN